ncbi:anaphase-promoting complex subunit 5 domain protein [Leptospira sp. 201903070]|uniref:Anaphase-promoting complex subunit 5 domain protein n=1 Tax=Leptospira ainlahdjerensis TaxID=2810033 RepID=A0ABS2UHD7_9LEPT|nr:anaphase-promoting complex subunit 5 domain protein [Leptospira ainlahdjerensis]MBM9579802.1 anaphase-promoting complex subunit 5 domain protein [Leptospira ainlahdjerensis]
MIIHPSLSQEETTSDYHSQFFSYLDRFDFDGAFKLLSSIFQKEECQNKKGKPTDFHYEEDANSIKKLFQHFQELNTAFHFSEPLESRIGRILENLEDSLTEDNLLKHRFKPFNGFLFKMSDYEFCNAVMDSIHFDSSEKKTSSALELNHEIIWDADSYPPEESSEYYDFIYDLKEGKYPISFQGKKIKGNDLHVHTKLLLFSKMISEIVGTLFKEERFAKIPKVFPFYVLIDSQECYDYKGKPFLLEILPAIELESLKENPHFALIQSSSQEKNQTSPEEEFLFAIDYLEKPDQKEYKRLLKLVNSHPEWKELLLMAAKQSLQRTQTVIGKPNWRRPSVKNEIADSDLSSNKTSTSVLNESELSVFWKKVQLYPPSYFSSFFWRLADLDPDLHLETANNFQKEIFLNSPQPLEDSYQDALPYIQEFSYTLIDSYLGIPKNRREELGSSFSEALLRLQELPHPGFKLRAMEIQSRLSLDDWESQISPILKSATEEYLKQMIGLVRCMPEKFPWFGEPWDFIFEDRLIPLGHQAKVVVPVLTDVLERYNRDYFNEDVTRNLAPVFYEIGAEDIHPLIHELHERNEFYMEEFYSKWSKQAPANRWESFAETIENSPESLSSSSVWEKFLYDSPPGFQLYYENIEKRKERDFIFRSFLQALQDQPFDLLQRFALFYSESKRKSAKKGNEDYFKILAETTEILRLLKPKLSLSKELQETFELGISSKAVEAFVKRKEKTEEILEQTLIELPKNPFLLFLKVKTIETNYGLKEAMEELKTILPNLWKEDHVLDKAFFLYCLQTHQDWSRISSEEVYAFYDKANDLFEKHFYMDGKFSGTLGSFKMDLFSKVLEEEYSKIILETHDTFLKQKKEEFKTLSTLDTLSMETMISYLKPGNSSLNLILVSKLIKHSKQFETSLFQSLEWETEEESIFSYLKLFYQDPFLKEKLVDHPLFLEHLSYFIRNYGDIDSKELAKSLFHLLKEKKNSKPIVKAVRTLDNETIINSFLSIHWAFQNENQLEELEELTDRILQKTDSRKPEYVLVAGNLSAMHILSGNLEKAKQIFQNLFSMDWSRFDYQKNEMALDMEKIIGPDINEQYAVIFRKYFAMAKYNAACLYSKLEDPTRAISFLKEAVSLEPKTYDREKIQSETDFSTICENHTYKEFLNSLN